MKEWRDAYSSRFNDFETWLYEELVDEFSLVDRDVEEGLLTAEVFKRLEGVPLVDRYDAYQILDDEWQQISQDLEVLQTEGFDAIKRVDPHLVVKKQKGKDVEVQDGWVGHILPFDLVQRELLADEATRVKALEDRLRRLVVGVHAEPQRDVAEHDDAGGQGAHREDGVHGFPQQRVLVCRLGSPL